jgi:hypothetical protein
MIRNHGVGVRPRPADRRSTDDKVTSDVKAAVFEYLANDNSGDQFIVMENEEPPTSVRERVNYYQFTGNPDLGRYGFFPPRPSSG